MARFAELAAWIKCSLVFSGHETEFSALLKKHGSAEGVLAGISRCRFDDTAVQSIIDECAAEGIEILTQQDEKFPRCFFETLPPVVVYVRGDTTALSEESSIGIIGARRASEYSLGVCRRFSGELAARGKVIVSGFALGTDQTAHCACLNSGGRTVSVLGCGIGYDYPHGCLELQRRIARQGAVISEFAPKTKPVPENFIRRNRLIGALSQKLLVIEASDKSGCLNTVSHALELGREVFVIPPHSIVQKRYAGQCGLIRDGADIAFQPSDLF